MTLDSYAVSPRSRNARAPALSRYAFDADNGARRTVEFRTKRRCISSPPPPTLAHCYGQIPAGDPILGFVMNGEELAAPWSLCLPSCGSAQIAINKRESKGDNCP